MSLYNLLEIDLITLNYNEIIKLSKEETDPESIAKTIRTLCCFERWSQS
jgi:hydroxymethylpyrimidine/phosphomethylpyrimidine kinase